MSILTKPEIFKALKKGIINITPFDARSVGPGSVDLTLSNKFRVFKKGTKVHDAATTDYRDITKQITAREIVVQPGQTVLGITKETITLSPGMCGWLEGRSRFARLGLMIHISAGFMQPGISNQQVLEITNLGGVALRLRAGTRICQFIFQKAKGKAIYTGIWKNQKEP